MSCAMGGLGVKFGRPWTTWGSLSRGHWAGAMRRPLATPLECLWELQPPLSPEQESLLSRQTHKGFFRMEKRLICCNRWIFVHFENLYQDQHCTHIIPEKPIGNRWKVSHPNNDLAIFNYGFVKYKCGGKKLNSRTDTKWQGLMGLRRFYTISCIFTCHI